MEHSLARPPTYCAPLSSLFAQPRPAPLTLIHPRMTGESCRWLSSSIPCTLYRYTYPATTRGPFDVTCHMLRNPYSIYVEVI